MTHTLTLKQQGFYIKKPFSRPDCSSFNGFIDGYEFIPRKNFGGHDIAQPGVTRGTRFGDIQNLKADCDNNPNCKGWNSYGDLKSTVEPLNSAKWHVWSGFSSCEGFYIKKSNRPDCTQFSGHLDGYLFVPRKNFGGYDIPQPNIVRGDRFGDIDNLKRDCDANPQCKGWNSFGDLKSGVEPLNSNKWHVWNGFSHCEGKRVRQGNREITAKESTKTDLIWYRTSLHRILCQKASSRLCQLRWPNGRLRFYSTQELWKLRYCTTRGGPRISLWRHCTAKTGL